MKYEFEFANINIPTAKKELFKSTGLYRMRRNLTVVCSICKQDFTGTKLQSKAKNPVCPKCRANQGSNNHCCLCNRYSNQLKGLPENPTEKLCTFCFQNKRRKLSETNPDLTLVKCSQCNRRTWKKTAIRYGGLCKYCYEYMNVDKNYKYTRNNSSKNKDKVN
jgi:hypothetical protein